MAEIVWRWTVASVSWLLFCFLLFEYLDSLPVSNGDLFMLRSGVPALRLGAIQHMLLSGTSRFVAAAMVCFLAICVAWVFAASVGRAATITVLLDQARREPMPEESNTRTANWRLSAGGPSKLLSKAVVLLHLWRAALLLATLAAFLGGAIVAGIAASDHQARPGIAFLLFLVLSWAIVILWYALDWLLTTAPIFAIRDGESAFGAISEALGFLCDRFAAIVRTSALFGVIHIIIFFVVTSLALAPLALLRILPPETVFLSILAVTLLYFVLIDFLRVARLAAYICIAATTEGVRPAPAE